MCNVETTMNRMSNAKKMEFFYTEQDNTMVEIMALKFGKRIY